MASWKELTVKTVNTFRQDGLGKVGQKAKLYLQHRQEAKQESGYAQGTFREVLFVNGCDATLPHPGRYRVSHQREQLESLGITTGEIYYRNLMLDTVKYYRIIIFFRCPWTAQIDEFVRRAKMLNKTVLYDVDDLVFDTVYTDMIPYLDNLSQEERSRYDENVRSMGKLLRMCDGAVTTTSCLAQELEQYVPQVLINRNVASEEMVKLSAEALRRREQQKNDSCAGQKKTGGTAEKAEETAGEEMTDGENAEYAVKAPVRIGYFSGSITHNDDFEMLLPVLLQMMEQYPHLELHLTGDLDLPEGLLPYQDRVVSHPFADWRTLPEMIAGMDINLAPLTSNTFNRAKSENKWMEAALVKIPTVASDIGAFHAMVENGRTGILCQNLEQWEEALRALIEQPQYRRLIAEAAYDYCMEHCTTAGTGKGLMDFLKEREKENIMVILPGFQISGGVMVALQHARILQQEGRDVTLFSIDERGKESWYEFEGAIFPVLNLPDCRIAAPVDRCVATMWSTCSWLDRLPVVGEKCYLVQNYEPDFYAAGDPLRMQARSTYGYHSDWHYLTISRWCEAWLYEQYSHQASYAPNGLSMKKFAECTPEEKRVSPFEGEAHRRIRVLIEGDSTAPHKNVDESFRIAQCLDPGQYEIWYMAYHGEPKDWYRVDRFLPEIPYAEVQEIYRQCDILLKSSVLESFSYPPLEMMATGGYVVAVANGGNSEYLVNEENCLLYPVGDVQAGAEAVRRIVEDVQLRSRLEQAGVQTAASRDWESLRSKILELYPPVKSI